MGRYLRLTIKVQFATRQSTKYACEHWHYSHKIPAGKLFSVGVWEDKHFLGVVIFSHGANPQIGKPYNLTHNQCVELTRVALRNHKGVFVSEILSKALNYLKKNQPNLVLIVSYADPNQGHKGGIYQATNWVYAGRGPSSFKYVRNGQSLHEKSISEFCGRHKALLKDFKGTRLEFVQTYWDKNIKRTKTPGKHKYLMPLNKKARRKLKPISLPYPKRAADGRNMKNIQLDLSDCVTSKL